MENNEQLAKYFVVENTSGVLSVSESFTTNRNLAYTYRDAATARGAATGVGGGVIGYPTIRDLVADTNRIEVVA